jgi:ketopantoate reductase
MDPFSIFKKRQEKKNSENFHKSMEIITAMKKLTELGVIKFDHNNRTVKLIETFWINRSMEWKKNFATNLKFYMDIAEKEDCNDPIDIFLIDTKTKKTTAFLASYSPITGLQIHSK